jgi:hypothetical protein
MAFLGEDFSKSLLANSRVNKVVLPTTLMYDNSAVAQVNSNILSDSDFRILEGYSDKNNFNVFEFVSSQRRLPWFPEVTNFYEPNSGYKAEFISNDYNSSLKIQTKNEHRDLSGNRLVLDVYTIGNTTNLKVSCGQSIVFDGLISPSMNLISVDLSCGEVINFRVQDLVRIKDIRGGDDSRLAGFAISGLSIINNTK